jgi:hypothetical protein
VRGVAPAEHARVALHHLLGQRQVALGPAHRERGVDLEHVERRAGVHRPDVHQALLARKLGGALGGGELLHDARGPVHGRRAVQRQDGLLLVEVVDHGRRKRPVRQEQ